MQASERLSHEVHALDGSVRPDQTEHVGNAQKFGIHKISWKRYRSMSSDSFQASWKRNLISFHTPAIRQQHPAR